MAVALRASSTFAQNAGSGNITHTMPPHATDDILIPVISQADIVQGTMAGYQELLFIPNGANHALVAFWKRAASAAEVAPTYTHAAGNGAGGFVLALSGMHTGQFPIMPLYVPANLQSGSGATATATAKDMDPAYSNSGILFVCGEGGSGTGGSGGNNFASWSGTNPTFTEACDNQAFNGSREACIGAAFGTSDGAATGDRTVNLSGLDAGAHTTISVMLELVEASVAVSYPVNRPTYGSFPKVRLG